MASRRRFLKGLAAGGLLAVAPVGARLGFASAPTDRRLVVILLRGGLDGLAAVVPVGDPDYGAARGGLALRSVGPALDDLFALHPALAPLSPLVEAGELRAAHAVATAYRDRSHFDAQNLLESGAARPYVLADGWLGRAAERIGGGALALGQNVPLLLRGRADVGSVAPGGGRGGDAALEASVAALYSDDPLLGPAFERGLEARGRVRTLLSDEDRRVIRRGRGPGGAAATGRLLGRLLAASDGPRIAAAELGGWDTHAAQGVERGALAARLGGLADGLLELKAGLGAAWSATAVLVITEFGRTVAPNGTGGTDHGTASAALLLGGAIRGGRTLAEWPGLARRDRHEGRDLRPTTDLRSIAAGLLREHLGLTGGDLAAAFPGGPSPASGLIRA